MKTVNHGVILGQRPTDYQAGQFTFIPYEVRNESGDWRPYLPTKEIQYGKEDSFACVSFSALNTLEIQYKFLTGEEVNYSDRWLAKVSGTTMWGNWVYKVADTIRKFGVVREASYPTPPQYTFAEYYADIPSGLAGQLEAEGKEWLNEWSIYSEFITPTKSEMLKHIKQAPLQVVIPGHAVVGFLCEQDIINFFDTYQPHEKQTAYANIQSVYKYVLSKKTTMETPKKLIINDGGKYYVVVLQGFAVGGAAAKTPQALNDLKSALEVSPDTPVYNYPQ